MKMKLIWVEIPVQDIQRAHQFYEAVFGLESDGITDDGVRKITTFRPGEGQAGITLNETENFEPRDNGVLVYLMVDDPMDIALEKVTNAGGTVQAGKDSMGSAFYAIINDTEGNVIGLYATE